MDQQNIYVDYVTAFAVVSATAGVEMVETFSSSLNSEMFVQFLNKLSTKYKG